MEEPKQIVVSINFIDYAKAAGPLIVLAGVVGFFAGHFFTIVTIAIPLGQ